MHCAPGHGIGRCRRTDAAMRPLLDTRLIDPSGKEPGLLADLREQRRALLFDLPDLAALPPRILLRVSHVFVTHTHMDHFAGFDQLLACGLGRQRRVVLWGGPGFVDQVEHKLRAYSWNVVHRYAVPLVFDVREVSPAGAGRRAEFSSRASFARTDRPGWQARGDTLLDTPDLRVRACFVDHEMPVLAFALEEKPRVRVAPDRLRALGLTTGPWLRELKRARRSGAPPATPITLRWRDRAGTHATERTLAELAPVVLDVVPGRRIGYVTDLRHSAANADALARLLSDADLLYIESVFLDADRAHALRKNHLTAAQAGALARRLRARAIVPFHFSPRYEGRSAELVQQARAAWGGSVDGFALGYT